MKIKAKVTEKQVRVAFPTRSMRAEGRTAVFRRKMSVTVTDMDPSCERVVALNLGQLSTLLNALTLLQTAVDVTGANAYSRNFASSLRESLAAVKEKQPGFVEGEVEAEGFEK